MSKTNEEVAVISTSKGEMVVEFWSDVAPDTVKNFKKLANEAFYDGTCFHRIVKGFMIQGGDPLTKDPHVKGVLSMARSSDPNSAGCQFFICLKAASFLDGEYTCFGELIKGEDVLETLGDVDCGGSGESSRPEERQDVLSISIVSRADAGVE